MKIAIVVHGRFHAFDLARALVERGHDVKLLTNYPRWAVKRFGIAPERVQSFWAHGVASRVSWAIHQRTKLPYAEAWLHRLFGAWAARELAKQEWDVIHSWSGVSEEILREPRLKHTMRFLVRGSAHVRAQAELLREEAQRVGKTIDCPTRWIIAREEREYMLADKIIVLSTFSYQTFIKYGLPPNKIALLVSGSNVKMFRPAPDVIEERCQRILKGAPIQVLHIGTFSYRKGMLDMAQVVKELSSKNFQFHFVGPIAPEARDLAQELSRHAIFTPKQPQVNLPRFYEAADIFASPTIEDGFQSVLGQAIASGLPILTTLNGAGTDVTQGDERGWIVPIHRPEAIIERLGWCDVHRRELAEMVKHIYYEYQQREWNDIANDYEQIVKNAKQESISHFSR